MNQTYSVTLTQIINECNLELLYSPRSTDEVIIHTADINRPGMAFNGFYEFFDPDRLQIIGNGEQSFLYTLSQDLREQRLRDFLSYSPVAVVIARSLDIPELEVLCKEYEVPLVRSADATSAFMAQLIAFLNVELAPRITRHGVLVEVYGEGVLLLGDSGVGKSETAVELVKRGHRLIADDAVEIRRVSAKTLVGSAPANIRHFIELRGIGIVNVRRIFGMGAVKLTEKIDMAIEMEPWDVNKVYDRMGLETHTMDILGIQVPQMTIPVKPGRNLAIIIEIAAMNNRQKKMGYNAAEELMHKLGMGDQAPVDPAVQEEWHKF
ncbi:MAG: HPr(Ser) kinase/phosphatase [Clostridia bacterium]|nr:HPr(Ser) kinase/phosphatase [Clostridia bacterium]